VNASRGRFNCSVDRSSHRGESGLISYTPYLLCYFFLFSYFFHVAAFFEKGRSGASAHWLDHQRFLSCRYTMPSHRGVVYRSFLSPLEGKFYFTKDSSETPIKVGDIVQEGPL